MRGKFVLLITALLAAAPTEATNSSTKIPLFGRTLIFKLPSGMEIANEKRSDTNVLIEFVPKGETLANWTRLVTVQAYRGLGQSPRTTAEIARQAFYPAACKIGPIYRDGGKKILLGGLQLSIIVNGCASLPKGAYPLAMKGAGEQDFIYLFRDSQTIYTLNYAVRGAPFAGKSSQNDIEDGEVLLQQVFGNVKL